MLCFRDVFLCVSFGVVIGKDYLCARYFPERPRLLPGGIPGCMLPSVVYWMVRVRQQVEWNTINVIIMMKQKTILIGVFAAILAIIGGAYLITHNTENGLSAAVSSTDDSSQFVTLTDVVPDAILEIRYFGTYNFVGTRIDGYEEPTALLTKKAAEALKAVSDDVRSQGYRLKIYDAYRPQKGVDHFMRWAEDFNDSLMKPYFYPDLEKEVLFPQEYICEKSGHTRGSTVDLTLFDMATEKELDMGGTFDWFGPESHPDFCGNPDTGEYTGDNHKSPKGRTITAEQFAHRMILRRAMTAHGFKPFDTEWWHFTLKDEPFPDTYFTFPVKQLNR